MHQKLILKPNTLKTKTSIKSWMSVSILIDEVNRLFYRMQSVEESVQKYENLDSGERSTIFLLATSEASIPELAFMRNVTRQRMHQIVKKLQKKKIVETSKNIRHLHSHKIKLSLHGKKIFLRMMHREKKIYKNILQLSEGKYHSAAKTLKDIRVEFENLVY